MGNDCNNEIHHPSDICNHNKNNDDDNHNENDGTENKDDKPNDDRALYLYFVLLLRVFCCCVPFHERFLRFRFSEAVAIECFDELPHVQFLVLLERYQQQNFELLQKLEGSKKKE